MIHSSGWNRSLFYFLATSLGGVGLVALDEAVEFAGQVELGSRFLDCYCGVYVCSFGYMSFPHGKRSLRL